MPEYWVKVKGWENPRRIIEDSGLIKFQTGIASHDDCRTCISHTTYVDKTLYKKRKLVKYSWISVEGVGRCVVLDGSFVKGSITEYLSKLLNLEITKIK